MPSSLISRRALVVRLALAPAGLGAAARAFAAPPNMESSVAANADGLTHSCEAIRQEITFKATPARVYAALTTSSQFDAITRLSDALALVTQPGAKPTSISKVVGGSFTLFGGYITGRNLQMLPGVRLVQAWHAASWKADEFSIAIFSLSADGSGTRLVFDHRGFPDGQGSHLASGWHSHYWEPMVKFLAQG